MEKVYSYNPRAHMGLTSGKLKVVVVTAAAAATVVDSYPQNSTFVRLL